MPSEVCEDDESKGNRKRILRVYKNLIKINNLYRLSLPRGCHEKS